MIGFDTLNSKAQIFTELKSGKYDWWKVLKENPLFYCEVRKDNQVNVYFEGGSVARLHYCSRHKALQAFAHRKYLGLDDGPTYVNCADTLSVQVNDMVDRIKKNYSRKKGDGKESRSEKYIQSQFIINNRERYIDSEFAFKSDKYDIRADLVELVKGELRFVELKRIGDGRMLMKTDDNPEIIAQMDSYERFVKEYGDEIVAYYVKLYDIKKALGLPVPPKKPMRINPRPYLWVFNTWVKPHYRRDEHTERMEAILQREMKDYSIVSDFDIKQFDEDEKRRQMRLIHRGFFGGTKFGGPWTVNHKVLSLPFIMHPDNSVNNLFEGIRSDALAYFDEYGIEWWNASVDGYCPPGHLLSSQIHCINHLFALRNNPKALLVMLNKLTGRQFDEVMPAIIDEDGYLSFEFTYHNADLLGENDKGAGRGTKCTSVDAFLMAREGNKKVLFPIEWKYTETYDWKDKTNPKRLARYEHLIQESSQLSIPKAGIPHSVYFHEPCYELMRQTLLMEQMVRHGVANEFIHINVIPEGNWELRGMVEHFFIPMLKDKNRFILTSPQALLVPLRDVEEHADLISYLSNRYWD